MLNRIARLGNPLLAMVVVALGFQAAPSLAGTVQVADGPAALIAETPSSGAARQPQLAFDPGSLDFGEVELGSESEPQTVLLQNTGSEDAPDLGYNDISAAGYLVDSEDCGAMLPAGQSCEIVIRLAPPIVGPLNTTLVASTPGHPPGLLILLGEGVEDTGPGVAELNFDPATMAFGEVPVGTTSPTLTTTLQNSGNAAAEDLIFNDIDGSGFDVDTSDCPSELPAGSSCDVSAAFTPAGEGSITPTVAAMASGIPPGLLTLSGTGIIQASPGIEVNPDSLEAVLRQGQLEQQTLEISSLGDAPLTWFVPEDYSEFNRRVEAMAVWDDGNGPAMYVGGELSGEFNGIARWDGQRWLPLGMGLGTLPSQTVRALAVYDDALIAAGTFRAAGGQTVERVARWDGQQWSALGSGLGGSPNVLGVYDGELIVGGNFSEAGGVPAQYIARWDGSEWAPLGSGTNGQVSSLTVFEGDLIAGGSFSAAGGVAAARVARWDGNEWSALGSGLQGSAMGPQLEIYNGVLVAAGSFNDAGGSPASGFAFWDGSEWSAPADGINGQVRTLAVFDGSLIVGGLVNEAGGMPVERVARWDGTGWSALGGGLLNSPGAAAVNTMAVLDDTLLVGGRFLQAGSVTARDVARWDGAEWADVVADPPVCAIPDWLEISPVAGELDPGQDQTVTVGFDTRHLAVGEFQADLCIVNNDSGTGLVTVPVELTVTEPPQADISPGTMDFSLPVGETATAVLDIGNLGPVDLDWRIGGNEPGVVVFDDINFTVPANPSGGSVQWQTGETCNCDDPPYNFNMWRTNTSGQLAFFWPAGGVNADAGAVSDGGTAYAVLAPGAMVGPASGFIDNVAPAGTANWRDEDGVDGYLGFRFLNDETDTVNYGYARIATTGIGGHPATITGWAYNRAGDPITISPLSAEGCDDPQDIPWLEATPSIGTTPPSGNAAVNVAVDAADLEAGDYQAMLCVVTTDPNALLVEIPVSLNVTGDPPPQIAVTPAELASSLQPETSETRTLIIANKGVETLEWWLVGEDRRTATGQASAGKDSRAIGVPAGDGGIAPAFLAEERLPGLYPGLRAGGVADCESEPGIIIHDDGTIEQGYNVDPGQYSQVTFVDRFTPSGYPATFPAVCVAFISLGPDSLDFEIVVYADDGPDASPGTELAVVPATASNIPVGAPEVVWSSFDLSSLELLVESGSVYIGVRFDTGLSIFLGADESPGNPVGHAGGYLQVNTIDDWFVTQSVAEEYRALFVRAVEAPVEGLPDCALPDWTAPDWITVLPQQGSIAGGESQEVAVTFDASGLAPGEYHAELCMASNAPDTPLVVVPLSLEVEKPPVGPGALTVTPLALDFGEVAIGTSSTGQFTVTHDGEADAGQLVLSSIHISSGGGSFVLTDGSCAEGLFLMPQESCTVQVEFGPSAPGSSTGAVEIASDDGQTASVELDGEGVEAVPPEDTIFRDRFEFREPMLGIVTNALPALHVLEAYEFTLTAADGVPPYTWEAEGLPDGLVLDPDTGTIANDPGQPAIAEGGDRELDIRVTDAAGGVDRITLPLEVVGVANVNVGDGVSCAVSTAGRGYCWGHNDAGQLGNGSVGEFGEPGLRPTPVVDPDDPGQPMTGLVDIASWRYHSCALTEAGAVYCWGWDSAGRLGTGTSSGDHVPVPAAVRDPENPEQPLTGATGITVGEMHGCASTISGVGYCWGDNFYGQIGTTSAGHHLVPTPVVDPAQPDQPLADIVHMGAGTFHSCAVTGDGSAYCWGWNVAGQLGNNQHTSGQIPTPMPQPVVDPENTDSPITGLSRIEGGNVHTCALTVEERAYCWGQNVYGQIGNNNAPDGSLVPAPVADPQSPGEPLEGLANVDPGGLQSCAVGSHGRVFCWGSNYHGQLGTGDNNDRPVPAPVLSPHGGFVGFDHVRTNRQHTCGVSQSGIAYCWGENENGELGDGSIESRNTPAPVWPVAGE